MGYFKDWWKSLFSNSGETDELGFPVLKREDIPPMPKVKPPKPDKDISEPVLGFIEVYKANPKRFKIKKEYTQEGSWSYTFKYTLYDTKENKTFSVCRTHYYTSCSELNWIPMVNTKWATQDEIQAVYDVVLNERYARKKEIQNSRAKSQREHLTKLYKGE